MSQFIAFFVTFGALLAEIFSTLLHLLYNYADAVEAVVWILDVPQCDGVCFLAPLVYHEMKEANNSIQILY